LTTNTPHGIYTGQRFLFQNVVSNNSGLQNNLDNQNFYVKKIDNNTVELYNDAALTSSVDANAWLSVPPGAMTKAYTANISNVVSTAVLNTNGSYTPSFRINTSTAHGIANGALMTATGFTYYTFLNGNSYYVKTFDAYPQMLQLFLDAGLTQPLDVTNYSPAYDLAGITGGGSFTVAVNVADIAETSPTIDSTSRQIRITTDTPHNLVAGVHDVVPAMPVQFSGSNFINFGTVTYYVKVVDNNTLDLFLDATLTQPARLADITFNKSGTAVSIDTTTIAWNGILASAPLTLQSAADITSYTGRSVTFGTNTLGLSTTTSYYIKAVAAHVAEVYTDAAMTVPFTIANVGLDTYGSTTLGLSNSDAAEYIGLTATSRPAQGVSYKGTFGITDADFTYRVYAAPYTLSAARPDPTSYSSIADRLADGQRFSFLNEFTNTTGSCWTKTEYLGYRTEIVAGVTPTTVYYHCYIIRFYSNRSCTTPLVVAGSTSSSNISTVQLSTYNRYYITTYSDLYGVKFTVTGKSSESASGPFTGSTSSGAAKLWSMKSSVTPTNIRVYNSTAHAALNYNNQTNPSNYYIKPTFVSSVSTEASSAYTYTVELFADSGLSVPVIIAAQTASISSVTGTLTTTISNLAHRTLRYVPIVDAYGVVKSGQRYTFSGAYTSAVNGTYYVKLIRTIAYVGQPQISLVELYTDAQQTALVNTNITETAAATPTFYFPFNSKVYSNLYYPKVTDNSDFPFRDGLQLAFAATHIPYLNGKTLYVKTRVEAVANDDVDIGRKRLDFYSDAAMTTLVDLYALAMAGTIAKLDYITGQTFVGSQQVLSFNSATPCVVKTSATNSAYASGNSVVMTGDLCRNFKDATLYVKFISTDTSGTYYELYTNSALTTPATYDPTAFTFTIAGSTTPSANEPYPYKVGSLNKYLQGTRWYRHYNSTLNSGAGGYEFAARAIGYRAQSGVTATVCTSNPVFTITSEVTTPATYSIGDISFNTAYPGKFSAGNELAIVFASVPDVGAPAGSVVDIENGLFNTHDAWTDASASIEKVWPTTIRPNSALMRIEQPTRVTTSQNQQRYTRSSGNIRYAIELTYPPMTKKEFSEYRAAIEAMQGQWNTCHLPLSIVLTDEDQVNGMCNLYNDVNPGETTGVLPAGSTVLSIEGLVPNSDTAIIKGQFISLNSIDNIGGTSTDGFPNGGMCVALHDSPSNSWGETKVRISHPSRAAIWAYADVNLQPDNIVVSLNSDTTEYNVNTAGYYSLKVSFICVGWA